MLVPRIELIKIINSCTHPTTMSDPLGPLPEGVDADPEYEKKLVSPATIKVRMLSSGDQAILR